MPFKRPPILVTVLGFGVLTFSAIQWMGLAAGLRLPELPLVVPRWYLWLKNALWGLGSLITAIALFFGQTWAPNLTRWLAGVLIGWYWFDRLLLVRSEFTQYTWPLAAAVTVSVAICLLWILSRRSVRGFFGR